MNETFDNFADATVLIVDDEDTQRLLTRDCLEDENFKVEEASNGADGIAMAQELRPDIILLDVNMPGMNGFEVCRYIRNDSGLCHTPIVLVTGAEDTQSIERGFAEGATDFITKPVLWGLLPYRVRFILRESALEATLREDKLMAESANKAKTSFLANMSHELRTPLNAILGFSEIIKSEAYGPGAVPQYIDYASEIHYSGKHLLHIVNEILDIVQIESGRMSLSLSELNVGRLVKPILRQLEVMAESAGVKLVNRVDDDANAIMADPLRLKQILLNLLSNAIKFTPEGGSAEVFTRMRDDGGLSIAVRDSGAGMSPDDLKKITQPFFQVDDALNRKHEGTGLGLSIVAAIAQLHDAELAFESEIGKGTTVWLHFPKTHVLEKPSQMDNEKKVAVGNM